MNYLLAIQIVVGLIVGVGVALIYFVVLGRQVESLVHGRATIYAVGGYLLRLVVIAAGLILMLWWSTAAGIATAVGFIGYQRIAIIRLKRATAANGSTEPRHSD